MRYFLDDGTYSHELSESELDLDRGLLNYENLVSYNEETKEYEAEEVGLYEPNPGNMTFAEMKAIAPMSDTDILKLIFQTDLSSIDELVDDETALHLQHLYPEWIPETFYHTGERRMYDGYLYKALSNHTAQEGWTPSAAPSLWARVLPGQDGTDISDWVQPDSTNPYMKGDRVMFGGALWESEIDNNVWAPGVYGWLLIS